MQYVSGGIDSIVSSTIALAGISCVIFVFCATAVTQNTKITHGIPISAIVLVCKHTSCKLGSLF